MNLKKNTTKALLFAMSILVFAGCNPLKHMMDMAQDQNITVDPSPLEVHADSISLEMSVTLPQEMFKKGPEFVYTVKPKYTYGNDAVELDGLEFDGEDYAEGAEQKPEDSKNYSFAYDPAMENGEYVIQGVATEKNTEDTMTTQEIPIAEGAITTSKLVQSAYQPVYATHGYNTGVELEKVNVNFYFKQGRSNLRNSEIKSDRGEKLRAFIADKNVTRTVTITGTHSPEGPERINEDLSKNRAKKIENYYRKQMDKYDYKGLADSINFVLKPIVEDWGLFKKHLKQYDGISQSEKQKYLDIVNGSGDFEKQEKRLQKLDTYDKVFNDLYPELRSARTEIIAVKDKKSKSEISVLAQKLVKGEVDADTLTANELAYAATLTPSLSEKEKIYKALIEKSESWHAHNNLGAVYLAQALKASDEDKKMQLLKNAENKLNVSIKSNNNAEAHSNLSAIYLMRGNLAKGRDHYQKAMNMSASWDKARSSMMANTGIGQIKLAEYSDALESLSNANQNADILFNMGLAQLLRNRYENAQNNFEQVLGKKSDYALAHYGNAIAAARMNNAEEVYSNLEKAAQANPDLKEKALDDLEFKEFAENQGFQDALK